MALRFSEYNTTKLGVGNSAWMFFGSDIYPHSIIPSIEIWSTSLGESSIHHLTEGEGNWSELTFAKTSGTVAGNRIKIWPIADQCDTNEPRSLCKQLSGVALSR